MYKNIFQHSAPGTYHTHLNNPNEDRILSQENNRFRITALADGVSTCSHSGIGAEITCRTIIEMLRDSGEFYMDFSPEKVVRYALHQIRHELQKAADEQNVPVREFASTAMFTMYDKKTKKLLYLNLGDGLIIGTSKNGCSVISKPSLSSNGCCVTTTTGAEQLTSAALIDASEFDSVLLLSDGAWKMIYDRGRISQEGIEMISSRNYSRLAEYMIHRNSFDDYSYIGMYLPSAAKSTKA